MTPDTETTPTLPPAQEASADAGTNQAADADATLGTLENPSLPPVPEQPPVDNDHVAEGATPFSEADIAANAPQDPAPISTAAGAEPFTQADGTPGPIVPDSPDAPKPQATSPVLLASVAVYQEADGRVSVVYEHAPQAFFKTAGDALHQAKEYVHQRLAHLLGG